MKLRKYILLGLAVAAMLLMVACDTSPNVPVTEQTVAQTAQTTLPTETVADGALGVGDRGDYGDGDVTTQPENEDKATEPKETEPMATEPTVTVPEETQPGTTEPETTTPEEGEISPTFSEYKAMSLEEQEAFVNSFANPQDFLDWWNAAKAAEEGSGNVSTGDPNIDLGNLTP